ncbi:tetratricopeptide repeat protein [Acetobacter sp. TBRC 12305]|uniref:Tetratricopeptide repeat protein n=1 Tax=Acetobacter garciniae TaxID=2817435 RepID=A0A939KQT2_9PROT|nr:tetratricopeptide repeat protein [Acetobacter garciniae]MBO1325884.1 tetratricopeptide repeat protein [Acetobacter garciniae]MBX0345784.1 tetratricopeptide repeat protein [Acetobacter garciniae]
MHHTDERPATPRGGPHAGEELAGQALALLGTGQAEQAAALLRVHLRHHPDDAHALHAMACIARAGGNAPAAIALAGRAIALRAEAHFHITLGLALHEAGQGQAARAALNVAVLATPTDPRAHDAMAVVLETLGRGADAERALRQALALRPLEAERHMALAAFLARQGRGGQALEFSDKALRLEGDNIAAHNLHGMLLDGCGRGAEAEPHFRRVAQAMPDNAAALANHGAALFATGAQEQAQVALEASLRFAPAVAQTSTNLGLVLMAQGALHAARTHLAQACRLGPGDARLMLNYAGVLADLGESEAATDLLQQAEARATNPQDRARARMNRGVIALAQGHFAEGWALFEARQALLPPPPAIAALPQWDGKPGAGADRSDMGAPGTPPSNGPQAGVFGADMSASGAHRSGITGADASPRPLPSHGAVLLHGEQGLGDCIQFLRYVEVAARHVPVLLAVPAALHGLVGQTRLGRNPRVRLLAVGEDGTRQAAARCSLLSLPHCLGVSDPFAWQADLAGLATPRPDGAERGRSFRLGLCWAGSARFQFDRRRSLNPALLAPLAAIEGVRVQALQPEAGHARAPFAVDALPEGDVLATARLMAGLDLVVSVDTMIIHLAGLLGVPALLLDRFGGDWRWADPSATKDGGVPPRSLWYPCVRILRQPAPGVGDGPWRPVVARAESLVRHMVRENG